MDWPFQQSYQTPLKDLPRFVRAVLGGVGEVRAGSVHIETLVFDPGTLNELLAANAVSTPATEGCTIAATDSQGAEALLTACLADWVDFFFVPQPTPFIVFGDHDEWTTVLAASLASLDAARRSVEEAGFPPLAPHAHRPRGQWRKP